MEALFTVEEMATTLGVTPRYLRDLVRQGRVPAYRLGRETLRFDGGAVMRALQLDAAKEVTGEPLGGHTTIDVADEDAKVFPDHGGDTPVYTPGK